MEVSPSGGTVPPSTPSPQRKNNGGVADYFAILGIGENLILKSTQKKNQLVSVSNENNETRTGDKTIDTNSETKDGKTKRMKMMIDEEEEFAMVERFYREIVEVAIFTVHSDSGGNDIGGTLATSPTMDSENIYNCNDSNTTGHNITTEVFNFHHDSVSQHNMSSSTENMREISSSKRNYVTRSTLVSIEQRDNESGEDNLPVEISGFKILYKTVPAGTGSGDMTRLNSNNESDNSFVNEQDLSLNTTSDALFGECPGTMAWNKEETYDADLHPKGLRGTILANVMRTENSTSCESEGGIDAGCQATSRQEGEPNGRLGNLVGKRVGKLRHRLAPILSNPAETATERCEDSNTAPKSSNTSPQRFYIGHRQRGPDEMDRPAISDLVILYCRVHNATIIPSDERLESTQDGSSRESTPKEPLPKKRLNAESVHRGATMALRRGLANGMDIATRVAASGTSHIGNRMRDLSKRDNTHPLDKREELSEHDSQGSMQNLIINLNEVLPLPDEFDEWVIPDMYQKLKIPLPNLSSGTNSSGKTSSDFVRSGSHRDEIEIDEESKMADRRMRKTFLFNHKKSPTSSENGVGIEAFVNGNTFLLPVSPNSLGSQDRRNPWSPVDGPPTDPNPSSPSLSTEHLNDHMDYNSKSKRNAFMPAMVPIDSLQDMDYAEKAEDTFIYVPIIAVRRQRVGYEERYREDPGVVDIEMSFSSTNGNPVMPFEDEIEDEENNENEDLILGKTPWSVSRVAHVFSHCNTTQEPVVGNAVGLPMIILRHNLPLGFADTPFATRVLDRFPREDYKGVPLPQEELPMFCYPTGCRLFRQKYQDASSPECYGFVVKNERGDSIHVSCVSFMEPLTASKEEQLCQMSERWRKTSLPHKFFCVERDRINNGLHVGGDKCGNDGNQQRYSTENILTGFDQVITFENKTICLVSRYPFWSAFRRFLSHLHILSGSSSTLPLERFISHLLLTVPVPKPGGQCILVPLPAIASPMVIFLPPSKDLPLLDLPFHRLFSCLDVPTVVTIVLGFLALEKKVIIMSSYPSLVTDACELLRSLLFPFELCAPYVPRLTQPFMSCLDFPGAIFAGIHDDGCDDGLAAKVRNEIPEDTAIVDLDSGDIDCNGDRYEYLKECWEIIPSEQRSILISEIEILCQNARIVPGCEPVGVEIEAAFNSSIAPPSDEEEVDELDDRAVRDCFLRFFCSILGGYERFLLVPDIDFLISGNEWFDTEGFLATTGDTTSAFLRAFVTTQHFQSFIQRRTEASDVHCLLFDECLSEYHSSKVSYGLSEGDDEQKKILGGGPTLRFNLLVDQCAADGFDGIDSDEMTTSEKSVLTSTTTTTEDGFMLNASGDLVTAPSYKYLPLGSRYVYCVDGSPCFPQSLNPDMFYPAEPECLSADFLEVPVPVLTRSDRELDVSKLRRKLAVSHRGVQRQRRCLFQLPKLMGSHVLNSILMCIPSQISNPKISSEQQARYLLRALGALRLLRSRQRIVPDEAGYRCLIVACGRAGSDRRVEIVKLFGLLRSDGIFPSAVTLGQYTRAIAEGFSKRSSGISDSSVVDSNRTDTAAISTTAKDEIFLGPLGNKDLITLLNLDRNIPELEESGRRWRHKKDKKRINDEMEQNIDEEEQTPQNDAQDTSRQKVLYKRKQWLPVRCSSSFSPHFDMSAFKGDFSNLVTNFKFLALWSRSTTCDKCDHVLMDEEVQAGWDEGGEDGDTLDTIKCPCCGSDVHPTIGYSEMTIDILTGKLVNISSTISKNDSSKEYDPLLTVVEEDAICNKLPPQIGRKVLDEQGSGGIVPYLSPSRMRIALEMHIEENGEYILERGRLRQLDPTVFFNLWWFCARFSLPLPLSISPPPPSSSKTINAYDNIIAFAAWDRSVAIDGCHSGAKAVLNLQASLKKKGRRAAGVQVQHLVQSFNKANNNNNCEIGQDQTVSISNNPQQTSITTECCAIVATSGAEINANDFPLLSHLTSSSTQGDWDDADLSSILVTLVEACDKRDLYPAITRVMQCNTKRRARYGRGSRLSSGVELECYRSLLYLTRYHCTSAFHKFFPSTCKPCKGYHFWCPNSTVDIFDRLFRDAVGRVRAQGNSTPIHSVSDVALGFRNVFGHII